MHLVRKLVQCGFALQAVAMVGGIFSTFSVFSMMRQAAEHDGMPIPGSGLLIASLLMFPLLGAIPTIAWWTIRKGKPSARRWAFAAGTLNVLILATGIRSWMRTGHLSTWPFDLLCGVTGILALIAFWRRENAAGIPRKSVRIAGDGTSKLKDYAAQGIAVVIIWLSMDSWSRWANHHDLSYPGMLSFLIQMELAVLLTTFGHELGHMVAGWASGKLLRSFQVGPFRWAIRNGAWKFDFNLRRFYGGAVGMVAPDLTDMRSRKAFFIIGGPVASLVLGSIAIVATLLTPGRAWQPYWLFLSMMANLSISAFVVNLIPLKPESDYSDGAQLIQIVTNGPWARVHFAFAMVTTSLVTPVRPRDFDVNAINQAADSVPTGERGLLLRLFACLHYLDRDCIPQAIASMEQAEALYDECKFEKPQDICAEFVFLNAFYKRDLAAAELWWRRVDSLRKVERDADYFRAKAALYWLRAEREEAREAWQRGNALAQKLPSAGTYDFTRSCFANLGAELDAPRQESFTALAGACELPELSFPMVAAS